MTYAHMPASNIKHNRHSATDSVVKSCINTWNKDELKIKKCQWSHYRTSIRVVIAESSTSLLPKDGGLRGTMIIAPIMAVVPMLVVVVVRRWLWGEVS